MNTLNQYVAEHDTGYFRRAMVQSQKHSALLTEVQLMQLNGINSTLDTLVDEVAAVRRTQAQGLAIQQAILAREVFQDKMEEFVYQFGKMVTEFQRPDTDYPPSTQFFLICGVFAIIERNTISTAVIRGRANKAAFDDCVTKAGTLLQQLLPHPEVKEAIAWAEAENRPQLALAEAERQREEAELKRRQEEARQKLRETIAAVLRVLKGFMPIQNCYTHPDIPQEKLRIALANFAVPAEECILGLLDITASGAATDGVLVGSYGICYRNQGFFAGKNKSGPAAIPYPRLLELTISKSRVNLIPVLLKFGDKGVLYANTPGWRNSLFDILTTVQQAVARVESNWASGRATAAAKWYSSKDGKARSGPFTDADLVEQARLGRLRPTDLVWKEGLAGWVAASKVKGLFPDPQVLDVLPVDDE